MDTIFACNITAFTPTQRERHHRLAQNLARREGLEELSNGYSLRFKYTPGLALELAEFMTLERLCCPFLTLALELEGEVLRLNLTGAEGVKPFIVAEFSLADIP
jgi:hypothetical protein